MGKVRKLSTIGIFGIVAAGSMILFVLGTWKGGPTVFIGEIAYLGHVIKIGLALAAVMIERKRKGGYLDFRPALKTGFSIFVLALAVQNFFIWLLMNVFDPAFRERVAHELLLNMESVYRRFGMPEDQISANITSQKGQNPFDASHSLMGFALSCVVYFLIALLIAAAVKRKQPLPQPISGEGI